MYYTDVMWQTLRQCFKLNNTLGIWCIELLQDVNVSKVTLVLRLVLFRSEYGQVPYPVHTVVAKNRCKEHNGHQIFVTADDLVCQCVVRGLVRQPQIIMACRFDSSKS